MIERGWKVLASDGGEIGRVAETIGDSNRDIFHGLSVSKGLVSRNVYVPAEQVGEIIDGEVRLTIGSGEAERLSGFDPPARSEQIRPE